MSRKLFLILSLALSLCFGAAALAEYSSSPAQGGMEICSLEVSPELLLEGNDSADRPPLELLPDFCLDINTASAEELDMLPGIGPALSEAIVQYRMEHGRFSCIEDIMNVSGIGPSRFNDISAYISTEPQGGA